MVVVDTVVVETVVVAVVVSVMEAMMAVVLATVVVTAVVGVELAVVSAGMILCFQKVRFSRYLKRRNGWTDERTDLRT